MHNVFFKPYQGKYFGFHWNFVYCADLDVNGITKNLQGNFYLVLGCLKHLDQLHLINPTIQTITETSLIITSIQFGSLEDFFIITVIVFLVTLMFNKQKNKRYLIYLLSLIFMSGLVNITADLR